MKKLDLKKLEKSYYYPKDFEVIKFSRRNYILVAGKGAPSEPAFQQAIGALYCVAYMISMSYRNPEFTISHFEPFVVPPLEGLWTSQNAPIEGRVKKEELIWQLMIRMPDFVTAEVVQTAKNLVFEKKKQDVSGVRFMAMADGLCLQTIHQGTYDNEGKTFAKMEAFAKQNGLTPVHKAFHHREIYLSDFRKTAPERLKTVLRLFVNEEREDEKN